MLPSIMGIPGKKVVIIGAGIAGLASAIRMRCRGYDVHIFDRNPFAGGKIGTWESSGYRFDTGPSLFTMPEYVFELVRLAGADPENDFPVFTLEEASRYFFEDGASFTGYTDPERLSHEIRQQLGTPSELTLRFLKDASDLYQRLGKIFLEKSLHQAKTWMSRDVAAALLRLPAGYLVRTMHQAHARRFNDPRLQQWADRFATYNGSDPYRAPALLSMIPHLEHGIGTFLPIHGIRQIADTLEQLARRIGVIFHLNTPVTRILHSNHRAEGIQISAGEFAADIVISNADILPLYRELLHDIKAPERILRQERSSSAMIFYWGIRNTFPKLGLHNIFFSKDYKAEFNALFHGGTVYEDPTVYVNITSKHIPSDAPAGCENWFVMVNAPADTGQDWNSIRSSVREQVLVKLSRMLGVDIGSLIETEDYLDPPRIRERTGSSGGSLYGTASNNPFAAFLRHPNFSRQIQNLYFTGGSVHPGGGIPLALLSARIVDHLIHPHHE